MIINQKRFNDSPFRILPRHLNNPTSGDPRRKPLSGLHNWRRPTPPQQQNARTFSFYAPVAIPQFQCVPSMLSKTNNVQYVISIRFIYFYYQIKFLNLFSGYSNKNRAFSSKNQVWLWQRAVSAIKNFKSIVVFLSDRNSFSLCSFFGSEISKLLIISCNDYFLF